MSDSALKKEFNRNDVQRLRNLITKKFDDSTKTQSGYNKDIEYHKEGDTWEEGNKIWTIKNGVKRNITQLEHIKKIVNIPTFCPECNKFMKHPIDKKMYVIHKKCMDCVAKFETQLKVDGKFEEYEKERVKNNVKTYIIDLESKFQEFLNEKSTFVTEQGDIEDWTGNVDHSAMIKEFNEYIEKLKKDFEIP